MWQKRIQGWLVKNMPKDYGKALWPGVGQREIPKDHHSCYHVCTPRDVYQSISVSTDQALQHVHIFFGIGTDPRLPSSCHTSAEVRVNQSSLPHLGG